MVRAISTVVAHFLHTEGVTGSNPVSPMKLVSSGKEKAELFDQPTDKAWLCD